ncbi:hypothetical protein DRI96_01410 [Candidatus Aerophobetes bacterium]|uniref:TonB-dependent receptor-like beta-barrel domain-containing protein n=1 Tax=Aerophobetes bacterium TaxID=2030807 RepID=A0A662DK27_UNCAE|nr:MAG: hypothetical protein DRI96_01410 [Candidatus Aerophobetes bacterium]
MRSYLYLFLVLILLFTSCISLAQENNKKTLTKLPTIVVKGEDRSYLQIIRPTQIYYMPYRGEKRKGEISWVIQLPPRGTFKIKLPSFPSFPSFPARMKLTIPPQMITKVPPVSLFPVSLSKSYLGKEKITFFWKKVKEGPPRREKIEKKELIHPPLQVSLVRKESFFPQVRPYLPPPPTKITKREEIRKIKAFNLPFFTLSRPYIKEGKIFISLKRGIREKITLSRKFPERKAVFAYHPPVKFPAKPVALIPSPEVSLKSLPPRPYYHKREMPPQFLKELSLRGSYIKAYIKEAKEKRTSLSIKVAEISGAPEEKKRLIQPPLTAPPVERVYFPEKIKNPKHYILLLSLGVDDNSGFNYGLTYGGEKETGRYLLTLKRDSSPKYAIYQGTGETLSKGKDFIKGEIGWGKFKENEAKVSVRGSQNTLGLPNAKKREDTSIYLSGKANIFKRWKINIWGEKSTREDKNTIKKKYDDFNYGISLAMQPQNSSFSIEGEINWDNLAQTSPFEKSKNKYQALLQIKSLHPFYLNKTLLLEPARIGVRGISDREAQIVGALKLRWYEKSTWDISLGVTKDFHFPTFSKTYICQDFSLVNLDLEPVNIARYTLKTSYSKPESIDASLEVFSQQGSDIVWVYSPEPGLSPQTVSLSRQGVTIKGRWYITPSVSLEPSYTWQTITNQQNPGKVIPHEPESHLQLVLTINLLKRKEDTLSFQAKGEWLDKLYYNFDPGSLLEPASVAQLKLAYKRRDWEAFIRVESKNYLLSKNYKLSKSRLDFGVSLKLF